MRHKPLPVRFTFPGSDDHGPMSGSERIAQAIDGLWERLHITEIANRSKNTSRERKLRFRAAQPPNSFGKDESDKSKYENTETPINNSVALTMALDALTLRPAVRSRSLQRLGLCHRIEQSARPEVWTRRQPLCCRRGNWRIELDCRLLRTGCWCRAVHRERHWLAHLQDRSPTVPHDGSGQSSVQSDKSGSGSLISGAADVAFIGNTLYVLLGGAGCSHGVPQVPAMPNGVIRVNANGTGSDRQPERVSNGFSCRPSQAGRF